MPRSKDIHRYPIEYFHALEVAAKTGIHRIPFALKSNAESMRLSFYALRKGIEEINFQPYVHFVRDLQFVIEGTTLVIRRGSDALTASLRDSLLPALPTAFEGTEPVFAQSPTDNENRIRQLMIDQGLIMPPSKVEETTRTPDQLISDLLQLKKDPHDKSV